MTVLCRRSEEPWIDFVASVLPDRHSASKRRRPEGYKERRGKGEREVVGEGAGERIGEGDGKG